MTEDIYSMPDKTKKMKTDRGEMEERIVDIYVSADTLRGQDPSSKAEDPTPEKRAEDQCSVSPLCPGAKGPERRLSRVAAVCLGLLCVLLLAGVIGLAVSCMEQVFQCGVQESEQPNHTDFRKNNNKTRQTVERDQLQMKYDNLTKKRDQLQTFNDNLTRERDQLQTINDNLTRERDQLQSKLDKLTRESDDMKRRPCYSKDGWTGFGLSFYYFSTEGKPWEESRQDCRERGADLVVIDSKEEQEFLYNFNQKVWIGLTDVEREGTWTWADGTPLTTTYWSIFQPDNYKRPDEGDEDCVEMLQNKNALQSWNDNYCGIKNYWICERRIE